ncbi:MAG TPA: response regulator [Desulfobacterales bacterium]|nr:response regulator [Desulfobacterales bacterium]
MLSTTINVTESKQVEGALEQRDEKYRTILETIADPVVLFDIECKVEYFNPAFTSVFGWTLDECFGKSMNVFVPEDAWPEIKPMSDKLLAGKKFSGIETHCYTKEGNIILVSISGAVYRDREGNPRGSAVNLRDISEQKKLERQFQQIQKMEAISTLAGGIAHDFNNLLMGIQGRTALMYLQTSPDHPHFEHLKAIEACIKSSVKLTKQLLGFARGGKYDIKPTDMNEIIDKSADRFGRLKKEVTIHLKSQTDIWSVEVDQKQIEQVLLNLYVNAWQAMPGGGDLYIQTENVVVDENCKRPYQVEPGKYIKISLTDTGIGMDKAIRKRIFDPFFTTKRMDRGAGLGLASVYGIIKNHGGFIDVYSAKGIGTTFKIHLPASEKEPVKEKNVCEKVLRGTERILFVDDEDIIIQVGKDMIESLGYEVRTAKNGKEAIEICKKNMDNIDMVMLDIIMPVMDGGETYDKLKEIKPDIKVLLSSGYGVNGQATEILNRGCNGFIQKPFDMKTLSKKIRNVLDIE